MSRHRFLDHPGPIPFAHRGGAGPWSENSWPAFENAVALGYRYLETDVRVTRDGTVMILHDSTLERVANRPGRLADLTLAEASRIRLHRPPTTAAATAAAAGGGPVVVAHAQAHARTGGERADSAVALPDGAFAGRIEAGWTGSDDGGPIPRLDDLLDRWPDMRLNLDVKEAAALEPTVEALRRTNALERVCVTSFDDAIAREARRLAGPALCVGAGMSAIAVARLRSVLPPWLSSVRLGGRQGGGAGSSDSSSDSDSDRMVPAQHGSSPRRGPSAARRPRRPRGLIGRDVVQVPVSFRAFPVCDARFVRYMNALGLPVHVWTVNDEASMSTLLGLGVEGIITDRPELLRDVLRRHNLWSAA